MKLNIKCFFSHLKSCKLISERCAFVDSALHLLKARASFYCGTIRVGEDDRGEIQQLHFVVFISQFQGHLNVCLCPGKEQEKMTYHYPLKSVLIMLEKPMCIRLVSLPNYYFF